MKEWQAGSGNSYAVCRYVVKDNEIYRDCAGKHVGFNMFSDEYLSVLSRAVKLPDVEFVQNLGDWPLSNEKLKRKFGNDTPFPLVSWCGSDDTFDMVLPTYDYTRTVLQGSIYNDIFSYTNGNDLSEQDLSGKIDKAIWRGRDSRQERLDLANLSNAHPEDLDAGITAFFFFPKDETIAVDRVPMSNFNNYQMIVNIDGTVAAYRMPYILAMSSLILKVKSKYYEHFYRGLQKFDESVIEDGYSDDDNDDDTRDDLGHNFETHYHEIKPDLSNLLSTISKIKSNLSSSSSSKLKQIYVNQVYNARKRALELLEPVSILCYHVEFFKRYNKLMSREVKIHKGMEKVDKNKDKGRWSHLCRDCGGKFENDDEDDIESNNSKNIKEEL